MDNDLFIPKQQFLNILVSKLLPESILVTSLKVVLPYLSGPQSKDINSIFFSEFKAPYNISGSPPSASTFTSFALFIFFPQKNSLK